MRGKWKIILVACFVLTLGSLFIHGCGASTATSASSSNTITGAIAGSKI